MISFTHLTVGAPQGLGWGVNEVPHTGAPTLALMLPSPSLFFPPVALNLPCQIKGTRPRPPTQTTSTHPRGAYVQSGGPYRGFHYPPPSDCVPEQTKFPL